MSPDTTIVPEKKPNILEIVKKHIFQNKTKAVEGRKCVDGGYRKDQSPGMIARPGADLGYVMALMLYAKQQNLQLSGNKCFDLVYNAIIGNGQKFYLHTDQHGDEGKVLIGCGHALKSTIADNAEEYGLDPQDTIEMVNYALEKAQTNQEQIENIHLDREHQEKGILIIDDEEYTVNPWDKEENNMFFVYDRARDDSFVKFLSEKLADKIPGLTYEGLKAASDQQLTATLKILAKGKPQFVVRFENGIESITEAGYVE